MFFKKFWTLSSTCKQESSKRGGGTTLRHDNWQLVEIYRDFIFFFSVAPCESSGEETILRLAMSCHNILYTPYTHTATQTHTHTHTQVRALSRHNDRLTRLPHKVDFDLHAGEKRGKGQGKNMEDAERRTSREEHTVLPLLNDPKGFYLLPTVCFLVFLASPCLPCPLLRLCTFFSSLLTLFSFVLATPYVFKNDFAIGFFR